MENGIKETVKKYHQEIAADGVYGYHSNKLSIQMATKKEYDNLVHFYPFKDKKVLDIGSGDGIVSFTIAKEGLKKLIGVDPVENAVAITNKKAKSLNLDAKVIFVCGNIYDYCPDDTFDVVVFSKTLHHLPYPKLAIEKAKKMANTILINEPNGLNFILKLIEKFSRFHIEHEEQSFTYMKLKRWLIETGWDVKTHKYHHLIPYFCPDWMAKICGALQPIVEKIPFIRSLVLGQVLILATLPPPPPDKS